MEKKKESLGFKQEIDKKQKEHKSYVMTKEKLTI
jgi:hypothetical protein